MSVALTSIGASRHPHNFHWNTPRDLILYSGSAFGVIYSPARKVILATLRHTFDSVLTTPFYVTSVRWLSVVSGSSLYCVTGTTHGTLHVWKYDSVSSDYECVTIHSEEECAITAIDAIEVSSGHHVVAYCNSYGVTRFLAIDLEAKICEEITSFALKPSQLQLCVSLEKFNDFLICVTGGVSGELFVYCAHMRQMTEMKLLTTLKGHEQWVQCVDLVETAGQFLIASGDQEGYLRIWRMLNVQNAEIEDFEISMLESFAIGEVSVAFIPESTLLAHRDWIYHVEWSGKADPRLLTVSMDKAVYIWAWDSAAELWDTQVTLGDVGGHTLGFVSGGFGPGEQSVAVISYSGALHSWECVDAEWRPVFSGVSGHFGPVRDIHWGENEGYLLTCSQDKTVRIYAEWKTAKTWHEISRCQIHGYGMSCIAPLASVPHRYVSGAEEMVLRIFDAPKPFIASVANITGQAGEDSDVLERVEKAMIPELGLSNREIETLDATAPVTEDLVLTSPPLEEDLVRNSLFVEADKLYGHGYEIYSVASNNSGTLIASASVAKHSQAAFAALIVWRLGSNKAFTAIGKLVGASQTVVQIAFSEDENFIVAVSRDRHVCVYSVEEILSGTASPQREISPVFVKKAHGRIIWGVSWLLNAEKEDKNYLLATGSRDKKVKLWHAKGNKWVVFHQLEPFESAVTALSWCQWKFGEEYTNLLAVGLENGSISIWTVVDGVGVRITDLRIGYEFE